MMMLRKNLHVKGFDVAQDELREVWHQVYRHHFLNRSLNSLRDCRNFYHYYQKGFSDTESEVCVSKFNFCGNFSKIQFFRFSGRLQCCRIVLSSTENVADHRERFADANN